MQPLGGVAIVFNWLLLFAAFSRASISIATAVYNTQPFMLVGLGALFFGERLTLTKLTWLGIAFGGMLLIVQAKPGAGDVGTDYLTGILLALGAAFFYAIAAIITKKLKGVPPHLIALIQVTVGIVDARALRQLRHLADRCADLGAACRRRRHPYRRDVHPALRRDPEAADASRRRAVLHLSGRRDPGRLPGLRPSPAAAADCSAPPPS